MAGGDVGLGSVIRIVAGPPASAGIRRIVRASNCKCCTCRSHCLISAILLMLEILHGFPEKGC